MDTNQLDEARFVVGNRFCPHKLDIESFDIKFRAQHRVVAGSLLTLNYLSYGDTVVIEPGELENFYLIQIPLEGFATIQNGGFYVESNPSIASILNPDRYTKMKWHAGCEQLLIYITREHLHSVVERHFGREFGRIVFNSEMKFDDHDLNRIRSAALSMAIDADQAYSISPTSSLNKRLQEENLIIELVERQESNIRCFASLNEKVAAPKHAKEARDFIVAYADQPISISDIAGACSLPIRTLQYQFKCFYDVSPTEFLKKERLRRIYSEITSGNSNLGVAELAAKWGFTHAGRFSEQFKNEFGTIPSSVDSNAKLLKDYH